MANWGDIWSGIGLLGQTKKGMYDPLRQATRRKGQVWKEGLGGIADTLGGIAQREDVQAFQGGQQAELLEADKAAQLRALKQAAGFHRDDQAMAGRRQAEIERAALASEAIARQEAANRGKLLEAQLADFEKPIDRAWRDALEEIALVFPEPFQGVDIETGYGVIYGLSSAKENDPEMFSKMDAHFRNYILTKYPNEAEALNGLWRTAIGGQATEMPEPAPEVTIETPSGPPPAPGEAYTSVGDFAKRQGMEFAGDVTRNWNEFLNDLDRLGIGKIFGRNVGGNEEERDAIGKLREIRRTLEGVAKDTVNEYIRELGADTITPTERIDQIFQAVERLKRGDEDLPTAGAALWGTNIQFNK